MLKIFRKLLAWICCFAILLGTTAQVTKPGSTVGTSLPSKLVQTLDSLRRADNLTEWLYTYRDYVNGDPVNRIALLTKAQSVAWRVCNTDSERSEYFYCLATQGYYLLFSGNILRSIDAYEQAYRFYFDKPIPGIDLLEFVLKPLGNNYTRLGDYDRAFFIQEKSLAIAEQKDSVQVSSICHNLATTSLWKGYLELAKHYCEKGLLSVKKNSALYGLLLSTLSEVDFKAKEIVPAESNSRQAIKILEYFLTDKNQPNTPYWLSGAYQNLGNIYKEKNQAAAAMHFYQKANALNDHYYKGQRKREKAQLFVLSGQALLQLQDPRKAMDNFQTALSLLLPSYKPQVNAGLPASNALYGENTLLDALHGKAACLEALHKKEEALQYYLLLFVVEKKLRFEFFSSTAKQQQQKEDRQWMESAIALAYQLWKEQGKKEYAVDVLLIAELSKAQLLLDEMKSNLQYNHILNQDSLVTRQSQIMQAISLYERETALDTITGKKDSNAITAKKELQYELSLLQKQVKEKYPGLGTLQEEEQLSSGESLLQNIVPQTTVVEFFTGEKDIYLIVAEKGTIQQIKKLENTTGLKQLINGFVDSWFQEGPEKMMNDPLGYQKDAYEVYHRLLNGVSLEKQPECLMIPDGIIGYLPFDALITDSIARSNMEQCSFLIRKTDLYYCYSLLTWQQQQKVKKKNTLFAGFFISFDSNNQASIPAVKKEYEAVRSMVNGDYFLEQKASLRAFNERLSDVNLLHISTHSYLQGKENIPVLQLADDKFFLFELYGKSFQPQLVVLSACRTGHGMLAEGEGIISLARGFTATGAGGIVAGLWNMNDESTAKLVGKFYEEIIKGSSPAAALHKAKLHWLMGSDEPGTLKLPYFWAGMIYSGNNEPVFIEKKGNTAKVWWLIGILIIILSLVRFKLRNNESNKQA